MLIIFVGIKGAVHKEFVQAGQTFFSAYYCDILKRVREIVLRILPKVLQQQKNLLLHHDNAPFHISLFTRKFSTESNLTVVPYPPNFSL
jgi:hypothetical protein